MGNTIDTDEHFNQIFNQISDLHFKYRSKYHLTYGELIVALKKVPASYFIAESLAGLGSYRGYYSDIAIFTEDNGLTTIDQRYDLPENANELGYLLESLLGKRFSGWKGGEYEITKEKPLWLTTERGVSQSVAIIGIDEDLNFITKQIED